MVGPFARPDGAESAPVHTAGRPVRPRPSALNHRPGFPADERRYPTTQP